MFIILFVYYVVCLVIGDKSYRIGLIYILIICCAISLNSKKIIWGDILSQSGYPLNESKINLFTVVSNFLLNILCIPFLGTIGAALATAMSHFVYGFFLKRETKRKTGISV